MSEDDLGGNARQHHARNLVIMLTAGGVLEDVLELAQAFQIRTSCVQQLAVPPEEQAAQRQLIDALRARPRSATVGS